MSRPVITLTTDFGSSSSYVAQMKGVILAVHDDAELVDLTHAIPPQQILVGAVTLVDVYHYFPRGTIHVAVVDPGVGTDRAIVLADIDGHFFVAPDNGLLGLVARRATPTRLVRVEAREFWRQPTSHTFHGRDIMAPVAAHLARGVDFERFGPSHPALKKLGLPDAVVGESSVEGIVLTVDSFGNLVTNLSQVELPGGVSQLTLRIDDRPAHILPVVATYAERPVDTCVLLAGSGGRLELAVVGGNAADKLGAGLGSRVRLHW